MPTIADVLARTKASTVPMLPVPAYAPASTGGVRVACAVGSMQRHMTDEGWQLMDGLHTAGYVLAGKGLYINTTNVPDVLARTNPAVVVMQDKREWDNGIKTFRDRHEHFTNVEALAARRDLFKLTVLKDSHQRPEYHAQSAREIGCHAWIVYYNEAVVKHLSGFVRQEHILRTYHTLDALAVPTSSKKIDAALLSGAVSDHYPLRKRLWTNVKQMPTVAALKHPGYHRNGSGTRAYMQELAKYKVSICTASIYGYALRKLIESTACGCTVITDLPVDEVLPEIDGNLHRVSSDASPQEIELLCRKLVADYDADKQQAFADAAKRRYDFRYECQRLAIEIERLKERYTGASPC